MESKDVSNTFASGITERFGALKNILLGGPLIFSLFLNLDKNNELSDRNTLID